MNASPGKVYLVGAGPGDPGLLTLRGKELLERADVVVYDGLVNDDLLKLAPQAETIFVGKRPASHTLTQEDIARVLVDQAQQHACIVRLKGGDPFVFGRGGEWSAPEPRNSRESTTRAASPVLEITKVCVAFAPTATSPKS